MELLEPHLVWGVVILLFPFIKALYFVVLESMLARRDRTRPFVGTHQLLKYTVFVSVLVSLYAATTSFDVTVRVTPAYALFFVLGGGLYTLTNALWRVVADVRPSENRLLVVLPALVGGTMEEVLFRHGLAAAIGTDGVSAYVFVVLSAVAFGFNHANFGKHEAAFKTLDGAVYAVLFVATGSVLAPIVAHLGYNVAFILRTCRIADSLGFPRPGAE